MKLDFSKCKTKEDVEEVMRGAVPEVKRLRDSFESVFGPSSGRVSSKDAGPSNAPRKLKP